MALKDRNRYRLSTFGRAQDVVGERGAGLVEQRGRPVTLALGAPDKNLASSPVDILELKSRQLAVANACGGDSSMTGPTAKVDRRRLADRIDGAANIIPRKSGRQMGQTPMGRSWNNGGQIQLVVASPMQKAEKRWDVRGRRRAGGRRYSTAARTSPPSVF